MSLPAWPQPQVDAHNRPYFEAIAAGRLCVQRCDACATWLAPGQLYCDACGAPDPGWQQVPGDGELYSFVVYHRAFHPDFEQALPWTVGLVELDEGPRLLAPLKDVGPGRPRVGMRLQAGFEDGAGGQRRLVFRPA